MSFFITGTEEYREGSVTKVAELRDEAKKFESHDKNLSPKKSRKNLSGMSSSCKAHERLTTRCAFELFGL